MTPKNIMIYLLSYIFSTHENMFHTHALSIKDDSGIQQTFIPSSNYFLIEKMKLKKYPFHLKITL